MVKKVSFVFILLLFLQSISTGLTSIPTTQSTELFEKTTPANSGNNTSGNNSGGGTAPVISNMTITPNNPVVGDILYCSWDYFDQENDPDQTTHWWRENGTMLAGAFGANSPLNTSSMQVGSQIDCMGDAYDGFNWGNTINSQVVTLGDPSTGGNNTGGNNTNQNNDSHCLTLGNFTMNNTYFVSIDLINNCSFAINYPGINASADHPGVSGFYNQTSWWYVIGANGTYSLSAQLQFDSSVFNGTNITLDFEAAILNCGINGSWHDCPNSNNATLSYQFQYIPLSSSLIIYSANVNPNNDIISVVYNSQNYNGYVNWVYDTSNGTSTSSSYSNSYIRTIYIYPTTFGVIQICGSIPGDTTCVNVTRNVRPLYGEINYPYDNLTTNSNSININYFAENYTSGEIDINNQTFYYLHSTNNVSNGNNSTFVNLPVGWSNLCLKLTGDNGTSLVDCIQIYREAPVERLVIDSLTLSSTNDYIIVQYHSENYSGNVNWVYDSLNGISTTSSYSNGYIRTTYIYPNIFGVIQICGTIDNSTSECVSVNRTARMVEGHLISPNNNSQHQSNTVYVSFTAQNYTNATISLNGATYAVFGSNFTPTNTSSNYSNSPIYQSLQIPYGLSTICLELTGEDETQLSDCITVERTVPYHSVSIIYPTTGVSFIGQYLNLNYALENSSSHYYTVDGALISPAGNNTNTVQLNVGFGTTTVCVVSYDLTSTAYSDCVTVNMIDPNLDTDSDGVIDTSDLCQNTPVNESVNNDGCSTSQLDTDLDGVADNLDLCPNTQMGSSVNTNGCATYQRDADGDGVMDNLDLCPTTPVNSVVDSNGCANSQIDTDNDGIMDNLDLCPNTFVGSQVNAQGCAPSQLDSDSDGVVDSFDQCPGTVIGTIVDLTGCEVNILDNSTSDNSSDQDDSNDVPSISLISTLAVIGAGLAFAARRKIEE